MSSKGSVKEKKKVPKQINWKSTGFEKRIVEGDDKEVEKVYKEMSAKYGPQTGFTFKSGKPFNREWFDDAVRAIKRKNGEQTLPKGGSVSKTSSKADSESSSKRTIPSTAAFAPKPVPSDYEWGSLALDRDMCYKHGNNVYTHDDLVREKSKDGWMPVYFYKEGINKNCILFMRPRSDDPGPPLQKFAPTKEPQVASKELLDSIKNTAQVQSSMGEVVSYLMEEKDVPNVDKTELANGVMRFTHKVLMMLLEQGAIRTSSTE